MSRNRKRRVAKHRIHRPMPIGGSPGQLAVDPGEAPPVVRVIAYGPESCVDATILDPKGLQPFLEKYPVVWIDVEGLGNEKTLREIADTFRLHRLALEDVVNLHQRAKVENYPGHRFIVAHMATYCERLESEQISMFQGHRFVLTFQTTPGDCLEPVRRRIADRVGRIRDADAGYLAYAILDAIVDHYFPILEEIGERLDRLEDDIVEHAREDVIPRIHGVKRDLLVLRRLVWPLNEAIATLSRFGETDLTEETRLHLRDCHDHTQRIIELVETFRETCADLMDVNLTLLNNRTNDIMKVLTIISTIFMPLAFIASVYGMNFDPSVSALNMPELRWKWGYPFALGLMAATAGLLTFFFRKKGWLGSKLGG